MVRRKLNQSRVLDAAELLVAKGGTVHLSLASLAQVLGVKPPSLYKHIDDLQGLRVALAVRAWEGIAGLTADLAREGGDPRQMARRWWRFAHERPGLFDAAEDPRVHNEPAVAAMRARAEARAERIFEQAGLEGIDAEHAWRALRGLVAGMTHVSRQHQRGSAIGMQESFSRALGALVRGWR